MTSPSIIHVTINKMAEDFKLILYKLPKGNLECCIVYGAGLHSPVYLQKRNF